MDVCGICDTGTESLSKLSLYSLRPLLGEVLNGDA